jgi:Protein of unknown function (DUF3050)
MTAVQPKDFADVTLVTPAAKHWDFVVERIIAAAGQNPTGPLSPSVNLEHSDMPTYYNDRLGSLRSALLDHPLYADVASIADLRRFMEDHVFAVCRC